MRVFSFLAAALLRATGTSWIAGDRLAHPFHPFGRVQPAVAKFDQPTRGSSDGVGARVVRVVGGGDIWREAVREREGLEGGGGRVARPILQGGAEPERPCFVKPAVQDAECGVVVAGNGD